MRLNKSDKIRKWFVKRGRATNREVIHKFDFIHGISNIVYEMKKKGHKIDTDRVHTKDSHYDVYIYRGKSNV